jgi:hypothetical protein
VPIEYVGDDGLPEEGQRAQSAAPVHTPTPAEYSRDLARAFRQRVEAGNGELPGKLEEMTGPNGRSRKFDLRCSEQEVARWEAAAGAEGISTSEFLRLAADERAATLSS